MAAIADRQTLVYLAENQRHFKGYNGKILKFTKNSHFSKNCQPYQADHSLPLIPRHFRTFPWGIVAKIPLYPKTLTHLRENAMVGMEVTPMPIPYMLTVSEAAQILRISSKTLYRLLRDGDLEYVVVRGSYRISSSAIMKYIDQGGTRSHVR